MAKTLVVNKLGNRRFTMYWPANATNAQQVADTLLDGEYEIYESKGVQGNQVVTGQYKHVLVMGQDDATHKKLYLNFYVPFGKSEDDIYAALSGKTFNGVKFDTVYVLRMRRLGTPAQQSGN